MKIEPTDDDDLPGDDAVAVVDSDGATPADAAEAVTGAESDVAMAVDDNQVTATDAAGDVTPAEEGHPPDVDEAVVPENAADTANAVDTTMAVVEDDAAPDVTTTEPLPVDTPMTTEGEAARDDTSAADGGQPATGTAADVVAPTDRHHVEGAVGGVTKKNEEPNSHAYDERCFCVHSV